MYRRALQRVLRLSTATPVEYSLTRPPKDKPLERAERVKRVLWRAQQRGWRELDLIVGSWAQQNVSRLSESELIEFEELLAEEIPDLYKWLSGQEPVPAIYSQHAIMQALLEHVKQGNIVKY